MQAGDKSRPNEFRTERFLQLILTLIFIAVLLHSGIDAATAFEGSVPADKKSPVEQGLFKEAESKRSGLPLFQVVGDKVLYLEQEGMGPDKEGTSAVLPQITELKASNDGETQTYDSGIHRKWWWWAWPWMMIIVSAISLIGFLRVFRQSVVHLGRN